MCRGDYGSVCRTGSHIILGTPRRGPRPGTEPERAMRGRVARCHPDGPARPASLEQADERPDEAYEHEDDQRRRRQDEHDAPGLPAHPRPPTGPPSWYPDRRRADLREAGIGRGRAPGGRGLIRRSQQAVRPAPDGDISSFGVVLAIALSGTVFGVAPSFLGLPPASVASDLLISVALALLFWAVVGFAVEIGEFGRAFEQEGWEDLLVTAALTIPPAVPFALAGVLDAAGWIEASLKSLALALCLPLALGVAATVDSFFIKPRLRPAPSRAERRAQGAQQTRPAPGAVVGGIAALVAWVLSNLANLLVVLDQLFSGG